MKKEKKLPTGLEEKVKQVKLDNADSKKSKKGVSECKVAQDTKMINPDMSTLDRGWS